MNEWKYSFDAVSKDEWLKLIKKDLKEAPIDSLQSEWWEGEYIDALHHQEDVLEKVVLPDEYFSVPPLVMEWIDTSAKNDSQIIRQLNDSLQYGAQSIIFENNGSSQPDWDKWLKGVHKEMVELNFNISSGNRKDISWLKNFPSSVRMRIYRHTDSTDELLKHLLSEKKPDLPFQLVYQIPSGSNWINDAVEMFKAIIRDYHHHSSGLVSQSDFFGMCRIMISSGSSFLKQIIQLRVIQLVWLNMTSGLTTQVPTIKSPVEYHVNGEEIANPDQHLISLAASSLAASLTGVNAICIHHLTSENIPVYYERTGRNIHHLLNLESQMYRGQDPLSGSYTIDFYTAKWSQSIIDKIPAAQ